MRSTKKYGRKRARKRATKSKRVRRYRGGAYHTGKLPNRLREAVKYERGLRPVDLSKAEKDAVKDAIGEDFETARNTFILAIDMYNARCETGIESEEELTDIRKRILQDIDEVFIKLLTAEISSEKRQELGSVLQNLKDRSVFIC